METRTRARGLAGCARGRALGDGVSGCRVAPAKVPDACTRMTGHSGRVPRLPDRPLRIPAKMMRGGARCACLIASRQLLEIRLTRSQQTRKLFLIASFSAVSAPLPTNPDPRIASFLFDTNLGVAESSRSLARITRPEGRRVPGRAIYPCR